MWPLMVVRWCLACVEYRAFHLLITDLCAFIPLTHSPTHPNAQQAGRRALLVLLRSWAGVTLLATHERKGLRALLHGVLGDASVDPAVRLAVFEVLEALLRPLVRVCCVCT